VRDRETMNTVRRERETLARVGRRGGRERGRERGSEGARERGREGERERERERLENGDSSVRVHARICERKEIKKRSIFMR
jgi:hypothetical protein